MDSSLNAHSHAPRQEQPAQNRSLERGLEILRAFRPGSDVMGNSEIAEKTGIARSTVSRLTQTLVCAGMLEYDSDLRAYRLGVTVLSLALAMRLSNQVLQVAIPHMRAASEKFRVNVGLATADRGEMVYLESIRYNRKVVLRTIVSGQRVPIELTSLGRAYLAAINEENRQKLLERLRAKGGIKAQKIEQEIIDAIENIRAHGFCAAAWQPEVVALATPLEVATPAIYILNMSVTTTESMESIVSELRSPLMELRKAIQHDLIRK